MYFKNLILMKIVYIVYKKCIYSYEELCIEQFICRWKISLSI